MKSWLRSRPYCINPVDSREAGMEKPETLVTVFEEPADVKIFDGFCEMDETASEGALQIP